MRTYIDVVADVEMNLTTYYIMILMSQKDIFGEIFNIRMYNRKLINFCLKHFFDKLLEVLERWWLIAELRFLCGS